MAPKLDKLGLLTNIDVMAFVAYCECVSDCLRYRKLIKDHGAVTKTDSGQLKRNPAVQMLNDSMRLMRQFLIEFGLTPSSRARVSTQIKNPDQPTLPGMNVESVNPNKPEIPEGPFTDDDYFGATASIN